MCSQQHRRVEHQLTDRVFGRTDNLDCTRQKFVGHELQIGRVVVLQQENLAERYLLCGRAFAVRHLRLQKLFALIQTINAEVDFQQEHISVHRCRIDVGLVGLNAGLCGCCRQRDEFVEGCFCFATAFHSIKADGTVQRGAG